MEDALSDISEGMWQEVEVFQMNHVRDENIMSALAHLMMAESVLRGEKISIEHAKQHVEFRWKNKQCGHAFMDARMSDSESDSKQNDDRARGKKHAREDAPSAPNTRAKKSASLV